MECRIWWWQWWRQYIIAEEFCLHSSQSDKKENIRKINTYLTYLDYTFTRTLTQTHKVRRFPSKLTYIQANT